MSTEFTKVSSAIGQFQSATSLPEADSNLFKIASMMASTEEGPDASILDMYLNDAITMFASRLAQHQMCGSNYQVGSLFTKCIELQTYSCISHIPARAIMSTLSRTKPCDKCVLSDPKARLLCIVVFLQLHRDGLQPVRGPKFTRAQLATIRELNHQISQGNYKQIYTRFARNFDCEKIFQ